MSMCAPRLSADKPRHRLMLLRGSLTGGVGAAAARWQRTFIPACMGARLCVCSTSCPMYHVSQKVCRHCCFCCRQYTVMAELVMSSGVDRAALQVRLR